MPKVRRGGYIFIAQAHCEIGSREREADEGQGIGQDSRADRTARARGAAVRIRTVKANNRRKAFEVWVNRKRLVFPFA